MIKDADHMIGFAAGDDVVNAQAICHIDSVHRFFSTHFNRHICATYLIIGRRQVVLRGILNSRLIFFRYSVDVRKNIFFPLKSVFLYFAHCSWYISQDQVDCVSIFRFYRRNVYITQVVVANNTPPHTVSNTTNDQYQSFKVALLVVS